MIRATVLAGLCLTNVLSSLRAEEPAKPATATKATYSISGLHCPPCARTIEASLRGVKGIRSAKVDWPTKTAKLEFDEQTVSAQQIATAVTGTPHMMGGGMKYGSWLVLSVPDLKDDAAAKTARETLGAVPGVASVTPFVAQHQLSVHFAPQGSLTTAALIDALGKAGFSAKTY